MCQDKPEKTPQKSVETAEQRGFEPRDPPTEAAARGTAKQQPSAEVTRICRSYIRRSREQQERDHRPPRGDGQTYSTIQSALDALWADQGSTTADTDLAS